MKLIEREYLPELISILHTSDIKVLTGVRRAGKSTLIRQLADYIKRNIPNSHLIHIDFNLMEFRYLRTAAALDEYVESRYQKQRDNYLLIDEVQMCPGFEWAINSFHASDRYKIVVTGSNAFLEYSDLGTLFVGRVYSMSLFPFSFREYCQYYPQLSLDEAFGYYLRDGGFAGSYDYPDLRQKNNYVSDIFRTLIVRDIVEKHKIKNEALLEKIIDFLTDNISNLTSSNKIANILNQNGSETNHTTVSNYLDYLCRSFAFYRVRRFDIKGKDYLRSQDKYYLVDPSLRRARLGDRFADWGLVCENIVAIELLRRNWEVCAGVINGHAIDFVAKKADRQMNIQVCADVSDPSTLKREIRSLLEIKNGYPKIILSNTHGQNGTLDGVLILDLTSWLQDPQFIHRWL